MSEDGLHEGYLAACFADGRRSSGSAADSAGRLRLAVDPRTPEVAEPSSARTRSAGGVTGWVVCCDCSTPWSSRPVATWVGPTFTRVSSPALEDVSARRLFSLDEDVADVAVRADVEEVVADLWSSEHTFGVDALAELTAAGLALRTARDRVDAAVTLARGAGASWAEVGAATGMTRQSAHERWGRA